MVVRCHRPISWLGLAWLAKPSQAKNHPQEVLSHVARLEESSLAPLEQPLHEACNYQLRVQVTERLFFANLGLGWALSAALHLGIGLAPVYISGGQLRADDDGRAVPLSTYIELPPAFHRCQNATPRTVLDVVFAGTDAGWQGNNKSVVRGPTFGRGTSVSSVAHSLREVIDLLDSAEPPLLLPVELRLPRQVSWYKWTSGLPPRRVAKYVLAASLHRAAAVAESRYMRCGGASPDVAAVARLAYRGSSVNSSANATYNSCVATLRKFNAQSLAAAPVQRCLHFLATDWFVAADGTLPTQHQRAMLRCWAEAQSEPSDPDWWWLSDLLMPRLVAGEPTLQRALQRDSVGVRLFLEVALLARARTCFARSHLGDVASMVRVGLGDNRSHCMK